MHLTFNKNEEWLEILTYSSKKGQGKYNISISRINLIIKNLDEKYRIELLRCIFSYKQNFLWLKKI